MPITSSDELTPHLHSLLETAENNNIGEDVILTDQEAYGRKTPRHVAESTGRA